MSQELIAVAKGVVDSLDRMREILPGYTDGHLITIARAFRDGANGASEEAEDGSEMPSTLAQAIEMILEDAGGRARNHEIVRLIRNRGWNPLCNGTNLEGLVGRTLKSDPRFISLVRGTWHLASHVKADDPRLIKKAATEGDLTDEQKVFKVLNRMGGPTLAKDIAKVLEVDTYWVVVRLRKLHKEGKANIAQKLTNGTALWVTA